MRRAIIAALTSVALATAPALGVDHSQHGAAQGTGSGAGHDMSTMSGPAAAGHSTHPGALIRQASVEGYALTYYLLDLQERAAYMKGMEGMKMDGMSDSPDVTNHLVVFFQKADGSYASGKVGFQVTGPDGKVFSTLTMGMSGGYGADLVLKAKGAYRIRTKAVVGEKILQDEFLHEVK